MMFYLYLVSCVPFSLYIISFVIFMTKRRRSFHIIDKTFDTLKKNKTIKSH